MTKWGINTLSMAFGEQDLTTHETIGQALKAGANCSSCIPKLKALIKEARLMNLASAH